MKFGPDKRTLMPLARERGGRESADLQKAHFLKVSTDRAVGKTTEGIIRAKSLWEFSFYFKITQQRGKEGFFPPLLSPHLPTPTLRYFCQLE